MNTKEEKKLLTLQSALLEAMYFVENLPYINGDVDSQQGDVLEIIDEALKEVKIGN